MGRKLFSFRLDEDGIEQLKKEADRVGISLTELVSRRLFSESEANFHDKKSKSIDRNSKKNLNQQDVQFTDSVSHQNTDSQLSDLILQLIIDKSSTNIKTQIPKLIQSIDNFVILHEKQQKQLDEIKNELREIKKKT